MENKENKPMQNMEEKLLTFKRKFDSQLTAFFDQKISQIEKIDPKTVRLVGQIKDFVLRGGKRLRPAFLFYGFKACGGRDEKKVSSFCLAVELFHAFALIHDDLIDHSDWRRGGPALHKVLSVPGAILAGDLCFSWAEEVFGEGKRRYWDLLKEEVVLGEYLETTLQVGKGQNFRRSSKILSAGEKKVLKIYEYKTARYSVVRPLQIGASLAGATKRELKILENYGLSLGTAFQIVDDILGMFGKEERVGKPADSDLKEGKMTLLIIKTISKLKCQMSNLKSTTQISKLKKLLFLLGNKNITKKDLKWVRDLIKETGALSYCQDKARELVNKAKGAIKNYPFEKEAKDFLLEIADFVVKRKY